MFITQEEIDAKRMLAVIEGDVEFEANDFRKIACVTDMILKIEEINNELGQVFLVKYKYKYHHSSGGHILFYTREEAELFVKLVNKK